MKKIYTKLLILACAVVFLNGKAFAMDKKAFKHFKLANEFYANGDISSAEIEYKNALELSGEEISIYLKLARLYSDEQDWNKALEYYKKASKISHSSMRLLDISAIEIYSRTLSSFIFTVDKSLHSIT